MEMNRMHPDQSLNSRRKFLKSSLLGTAGIVYIPALSHCSNPVKENPVNENGLLLNVYKIDGLSKVDGPDYLENAAWYETAHAKTGLMFEFPAGTLAGKEFITADMLVDGTHMVKFNIELREGPEGNAFQFVFGVLNQCSLRIRFPLHLVDQNTWLIPREGAFLKPMCYGDRVDLDKVDRMRFYVDRKSDQKTLFCITDFRATENTVSLVEHPVLPKGKLLDQLGQSTIHDWEGKTAGTDELIDNLKTRKEITHEFPGQFSVWGGQKNLKIGQGSGFFETTFEGNRWWLVDPDGFAFWSAGVDCVRVDTTANVHLLEDALSFNPENDESFSAMFSERNGEKHVNYLAANFIRAFGMDDWKEIWAGMALDELRRLRFNTVGNWSEWAYASKSAFPYVIPMSFRARETKMIYRDFPDVFDANFEADARKYAEVLKDTADDPALIGYFMMNEPTWAFSSELPAAGMLYNTESCATRSQLTDFLRNKYPSEGDLAKSWNMDIGFAEIENGRWAGKFSSGASKDLEDFSEIMVEKYFGTLAKACKQIDNNHLNLGIRYAGVPPKWAVKGMKSFDVFSMNNYRDKVPFETTKEINTLLNMPVIIGEWHFGALDVGLPSSGIGHVRSQTDRGKAYRVYFEDAAANPYCIGVHWFTLYDQSAIGRFDGENYNIGFLDVCHRPYQEISAAAIQSHEQMYDIASGKVQPFNDVPEYLPMLFI